MRLASVTRRYPATPPTRAGARRMRRDQAGRIVGRDKRLQQDGARRAARPHREHVDPQLPRAARIGVRGRDRLEEAHAVAERAGEAWRVPRVQRHPRLRPAQLVGMPGIAIGDQDVRGLERDGARRRLRRRGRRRVGSRPADATGAHPARRASSATSAAPLARRRSGRGIVSPLPGRRLRTGKSSWGSGRPAPRAYRAAWLRAIGRGSVY